MSPVQVTHFRCAKKDQRTDLPVLNSSEKPVWIIISWAACLSWGTGLTTSAFPWLKAHSPNTWPDHFTLLKTEGTDSHRTLFCTGRNLFRNCPCLLYYQVVTNIFFYPIADCISTFHRAECFWTRTFSHGAPATAHSHKFDCCPLCFSRVVLAMELPALLLPLSTGDSGNGTEPKIASVVCVEREVTMLDPEVSTLRCAETQTCSVFACCPPQWQEPIMGHLEQGYVLTLNIPGDAIFLKLPNSCSELRKVILHLQQAALYVKKKLLVENTLDSLQHLYGKPLMHHVPHTWNSTIPAVN